MYNQLVKKTKATLHYSCKLFILTSFLASQLFLPGIFSHQSNPDGNSINIAKAGTVDPWYDTSWLYRKQVNITGSGSNLTNYQVKLTVSYVAGKMKTDFSDLRFTDANGTTLYNYFIESKTDSVSADVWVKVGSIPMAGTYVYMYYGNNGASSASSGNNTFTFFDDFTSLSGANWTASGNIQIRDGSTCLVVMTGGSPSSITSTATYGTNTALVYRASFENNGWMTGGYSSNPDPFTSGANRANWYKRGSYRAHIENSSGNTDVTDGAISGTAYHIWEIDRNASTSGIFKADGNVLNTLTDFVPTGSLPLVFSSYEQNETYFWIDWVGVRQFASPEPSPTFSSEESYSLSPLSSWSYRKAITIDSSKVSGTGNLSNFPVLINLPSDTNLHDHARADGSDIIFVPANIDWSSGNQSSQLKYEIESYNNSTGSLQAWVKIPALYSSNNFPTTTFYMYYGNSSASSNTVANVQGVWDDGGNNYHKAVWHMKESAIGALGDFKDSTVNSYNSANTTSEPTQITGIIGKGQSFDGNNDRVVITPSVLSGTGAFSLEVWIKTSSTGTQSIIQQKDSSNANGQYTLGMGGGAVGYNDYLAGPGFEFGSATNIADNNWHQIVFTRNGGNAYIYIDGVLDASDTGMSKSISSNLTMAFGIDYSWGGNRFNGSMDEIHVSTTARSANWITTEYNNQSTVPNTGNFIMPLGSEENATSPALTEITPVPAFTIDTTPTYIFNSTKAGTISYTGDCSSSTTSAISGNNTITFNTLSQGAHSNCIIRVTDTFGNQPTLSVATFSIDTTSPTAFTLSSPSDGARISSKTPTFSWNASSDAVAGLDKYQLYVDGMMEVDNIPNSTVSAFASNELFCGDHTWQVKALDTLGYITDSDTSAFTINCGGGIITPQKPLIKDITITILENGSVSFGGLSEKIVQIAVSTDSSFAGASWENLQDKDDIFGKYVGNGDLYIRFRTADGAVSDTLIWERSASVDTNVQNKLYEGDIVKTPDSFDVYIIKYKNTKQYKRLVLSPSVFNSYQHLKWENIKIIPRAEMDRYTTSSLVRETNDAIIYELTANGDTGKRKPLDILNIYDPDSIYEINAVDRDSYALTR